MAKGNRPKVIPKEQWVAHPYRDHANQPAVLMMRQIINIQEMKEAGDELAPNLQFAIQIYSVLPLDSDYTTLCEYLSREISSWPSISVEI